MARPLRVEAEKTFFHVLNRGVERRTIFEDKTDCLKSLKLLDTCAERFQLEVWSFVLMGNHFLCGTPHNTCYVQAEIM